MTDTTPCANTIFLDKHLREQDELQERSATISKIIDNLVDEEIICVKSSAVVNSISKCEQQWETLMEMEDIDVDSAPVAKVLRLAKLAQAFKDQLQEVMRDELEGKAAEEYDNL